MFLLQIWPVQVDPDRDEEVHMFFARGERWRRLRSIANPAFSTCKMRLVSNLSLCLSVSVCLSVCLSLVCNPLLLLYLPQCFLYF